MNENGETNIVESTGPKVEVILQMDCCPRITFEGRLVIREELEERLWSNNSFVDFEHSLNAAIKSLHQALEGSADTPCFIDSLPRHGYRFVHPGKGMPADGPRPFLPPSPSSVARFWSSVVQSPTTPPKDVLSLKADHERLEGLQNQPTTEVAQQLGEDPPSLIGCQLGPYQVVSLLRVGGMGEVYKALDTRLERTVALKILPAEMTSMVDRLKRFQQEARAISTLNHPHICTLYDIGEYSGRLFLVMEYLDGETLADRLRRGPLPLDKTLEIGVEMADALEAAHKQGIVHRDLKPGNVMLTRTGAKLIDFGLAKLKRQEAADASAMETATQTTPGLVIGTLAYMSPEQLEGQPVDGRTDLWALGAMLYEMLTGKRAFGAKSQAGVIAAILEHELPPLDTIQPLTPPPLDRLVRRCLAKSPDARWDSAHDVTDELRWIRDSSGAVSSVGKKGHPIRKWKWAAMDLLRAVALVLGAGTGL